MSEPVFKIFNTLVQVYESNETLSLKKFNSICNEVKQRLAPVQSSSFFSRKPHPSTEKLYAELIKQLRLLPTHEIQREATAEETKLPTALVDLVMSYTR